jgi:hypothetical protein
MIQQQAKDFWAIPGLRRVKEGSFPAFLRDHCTAEN